MNINYSLIISIICTIVTSIIAILNYKNAKGTKINDEIKDRVKRDTEISTKLDMVITGNVELKNEIKNINNKFDDMNERVARCEENAKHANERIERLEQKV